MGLILKCKNCDTEAVEAPGIGPYCPNQDCGVADGPELREVGTDLSNWEWGPERETLTCTWIVPWAGECEKPVVSDDPPRCERHNENWMEDCVVCGEQAVKGCDATMGLVCGAPLCEKHTASECPRH